MVSSAQLQWIPALLPCSPMPVEILLHPAQHMNPPWLLLPRAGQGADLGVPSAAFLLLSRSSCPAEEANFSNGGRNVASLQLLPFVWRSATSGRAEGLAVQLHAFCCHKEKGFRQKKFPSFLHSSLLQYIFVHLQLSVHYFSSSPTCQVIQVPHSKFVLGRISPFYYSYFLRRQRRSYKRRHLIHSPATGSLCDQRQAT